MEINRLYAAIAKGGGWALALILPAMAQAQSHVIPTDSLRQARPADFPEELRMPSWRNGLDLAFNHEDLKGMYTWRGFDTCQTTSAGPSMFSKNFANFGSDCFAKYRDDYYRNFATHYRNHNGTYLLPKYPWNGTRLSDISKSAGTRFASRTVTRAFRSSTFLSNLVEGKIAFDFSLDGIAEKLSSPPVSADPRPSYQLRTERFSASQDRLGAGLGVSGSAALASLGRDWSSGSAAQREIVEVWPESMGSKQPQVVQEPGYGKRMAGRLGLPTVPFSKFGMRIERRPDANQEDIFLRFAESSDLVYAEFNQLLRGKTESIAYGYKIPYLRHSLNVRYANMQDKAVTTYTFLINDNNRADFVYNPNDRSYSAGFKRELQ